MSDQYLIRRKFGAESLLIDRSQYAKLIEFGSASNIASAPYVTVNGKTIATNTIETIEPYRNYEQENKWTPPAVAQCNPKNLDHLKELKTALFDRHEKYDPETHLPPEWR